MHKNHIENFETIGNILSDTESKVTDKLEDEKKKLIGNLQNDVKDWDKSRNEYVKDVKDTLKSVSKKSPYLGKNVMLTNTEGDPIISGYVTNKGDFKLYANDTVFSNTAGNNGCPANITEAPTSIKPGEKMVFKPKIPTDPGMTNGKPMIPGQSCGNEGDNIWITDVKDSSKPEMIGCMIKNSIEAKLEENERYALKNHVNSFDECKNYALVRGKDSFAYSENANSDKLKCVIGNSTDFKKAIKANENLWMTCNDNQRVALNNNCGVEATWTSNTNSSKYDSPCGKIAKVTSVDGTLENCRVNMGVLDFRGNFSLFQYSKENGKVREIPPEIKTPEEWIVFSTYLFNQDISTNVIHGRYYDEAVWTTNVANDKCSPVYGGVINNVQASYGLNCLASRSPYAESADSGKIYAGTPTQDIANALYKGANAIQKNPEALKNASKAIGMIPEPAGIVAGIGAGLVYGGYKAWEHHKHKLAGEKKKEEIGPYPGNWSDITAPFVENRVTANYTPLVGGWEDPEYPAGEDPAVGCAKVFDTTYRCGTMPKKITLDAEAAGKTVNYDCGSETKDCGFYIMMIQDDGNLVIYKNEHGGRVMWSSNTYGPKYSGEVANNDLLKDRREGRSWIASGEIMHPGEYIASDNGKNFAILQEDGNFVVYRTIRPCKKEGDHEVGKSNTYALYNVDNIGHNALGKVGYITSDAMLKQYPDNLVEKDSEYQIYKDKAPISTNYVLISDPSGGSVDIEYAKNICNKSNKCTGFVKFSDNKFFMINDDYTTIFTNIVNQKGNNLYVKKPKVLN